MRQITLLTIVLLIVSVNLKSQDLDSASISNCIVLQDKGLLIEARNCFLEYDNNIYAIYGAAVISKDLSDLKSVNKLSKKLLSKKYRSPISYQLCADLYADDSIKYFGVLKKGLKIYENDTILLIYQTNYYLENNDFISAINSIDKLIQHKKDNNKSLFFARGYSYEMINDYNNALSSYKKSIDLDSNYFDSNYNLGVLYYNSAVKLYDKLNAEIDENDYKRLKEEADSELTKSIPYLEKAHKIKPDDIHVLNALKTIYYRLKYESEYQKISNMIDELIN